MDLEYCIACGEPTGRAGRGDDSLYHDNGSGPYCLECFETVERLSEENAALRSRLAEAEECLTIAHMDGYHKGQKAGQSELSDERRDHEQTKRVMADEIQRLKAENALIAESYKKAHDEVILLRRQLNAGG